MLEIIKAIDAFPKQYDEFRVKTKTGAIVSIISILIMVIIFISELKYYMHTEIVDTLYVNTSWTEKLKVSFDISFPQISCNLISLDVIDETGLPQKDVASEIYKHRLSTTGERKGVKELHILGDSIRSENQLMTKTATPPDEIINLKSDSDVPCGNCYGAGDCCATCDDVKKAYERKGWSFNPANVKQCEKEVRLDNWKDENSNDGGCQIYGMMELNKASGHFHIAPHKKLQQAGAETGLIDFLELISFTFSQFNITHKINSLRFGDHFAGIKSPLDGQIRTLQDTHGMYQYYLKIVPTIYKNLKGKSIESNQYAVTEHMRHLAPGSGRGLPGLYFYYEISPVQAIFEEKRGHGGFWRFLTSVCAVVGGSFTLFGLVDILILYLMDIYKKSLLQ